MHKAKKLPYKTCMLTVPDTHMNTVLTSRERERERAHVCVYACDDYFAWTRTAVSYNS